MLKKEILFMGKKAVVGCDEKCEKAWGINRRPSIKLDENNEDDYAYLSDKELGLAPIHPGTWEGGDAKPTKKEERLNKWCVRECERCSLSKPGEYSLPLTVKDFSERVYNIPRTVQERTEQ